MRRRIPFRYKFVLSLFLGLVPAVGAFLIHGVSKPDEVRIVSAAKPRQRPLLDPFGTVISVVAYAKDPTDQTYRLLPPQFGYETVGGIELTASDDLAWNVDAVDLTGESSSAALPPGLDWAVAPATPAMVSQGRERTAPVSMGMANGGINPGAGTTAPLTAVSLGSGGAGLRGSTPASASAQSLMVPPAGGSIGVQQPERQLAAGVAQGSVLGVPNTRTAGGGGAIVVGGVVNLASAPGAAGRSSLTAAGAGSGSASSPNAEPAVSAAAASASEPAAAVANQALAASTGTSAPAGPGLAVLGELMRGSWARSQESAPVLTPKDLVNLATALAAGTPVPEPATWAVLSIGLAIVGLRARRR